MSNNGIRRISRAQWKAMGTLVLSGIVIALLSVMYIVLSLRADHRHAQAIQQQVEQRVTKSIEQKYELVPRAQEKKP